MEHPSEARNSRTPKRRLTTENHDLTPGGYNTSDYQSPSSISESSDHQSSPRSRRKIGVHEFRVVPRM